MMLFFRMEFKAYTDVKPVKPIKAKSQYKLATEDKANLETSYSATYKGEQGKPEAADNKLLERRRIRSLYNEPSIKESSKVCKLYSTVSQDTFDSRLFTISNQITLLRHNTESRYKIHWGCFTFS